MLPRPHTIGRPSMCLRDRAVASSEIKHAEHRASKMVPATAALCGIASLPMFETNVIRQRLGAGTRSLSGWVNRVLRRKAPPCGGSTGVAGGAPSIWTIWSPPDKPRLASHGRHALVAQLDRASDFESESGIESLRARQHATACYSLRKEPPRFLVRPLPGRSAGPADAPAGRARPRRRDLRRR
jgi:hypothetical protein